MEATALLFMAALSASQGQALQLEVPHLEGLESVAIEWSERSVPFVRDDDRWFTVIGVDLDTSAGDYPVEVTMAYADGRVVKQPESVEVLGMSFPTTELTVAPGYVQLSPENQERAARESREIGAVYATLTPTAYWDEPFIVPIPGARDGRNFGHRRIFNGEPRAPHSGADLSASTGTEIHASNAGRVVLAKDFFFNGNAVFIDHGLGLYT
ncbi:MAG: peptidoglycan DD-metalloendopeptidase family protein, partial [Rhodospirillaceae bacterium]|nr:peptidoglycan DD-metalloendopeptidase family protein [Rhodospirillaceae bacterium]